MRDNSSDKPRQGVDNEDISRKSRRRPGSGSDPQFRPAAVGHAQIHEPREKWLDLCGAEAPKYKKQFLIKRLAYHIQELFYGGLSEQARAHLRRLASNDPVATVKRRIPEERKSNEAILPGTRLVRVWKDRRPVHLLHLPKRRQAHRKPLPAQTRAGRRYRAGGRRTVERRIPDPDAGGQDLFCRPGN